MDDSFLFPRFFLLGLFTFIFLPILLLIDAIKQLTRKIFPFAFCKNIAGEIAVVTGGAHGLGREISIELAKKGCHIAIADINLAGAEETAKMIKEKHENVKVKAYKVDVTDYEQVVALNANITNDLGAATILVNNAGILLFSNLTDPDWREVQRMINVNLTAHFWLNRVFLPKMKELKRGHIVAICSAASLFTIIFNSEYTSTKCAVRGMMRVLRQELKYGQFKNINTTTVYPYFLQTNANVYEMAKRTGMDNMIDAISGEKAAKQIVQGVLQNEVQIVMPYYLKFVYILLEILPADWTDFLMMAPIGTVLDRYVNFVRSRKLE